MKAKAKDIRQVVRMTEETYHGYLLLEKLTGEKWTKYARTDMAEGVLKRLHDDGVLDKMKEGIL